MTDREVMQHIMQILGPESTCECMGCSWEVNESLRLLREQGIEYQERKPKIIPHDPIAERRGN